MLVLLLVVRFTQQDGGGRIFVKTERLLVRVRDLCPSSEAPQTTERCLVFIARRRVPQATQEIFRRHIITVGVIATSPPAVITLHLAGVTPHHKSVESRGYDTIKVLTTRQPDD